jgi:hypothetical membrane protein
VSGPLLGFDRRCRLGGLLLALGSAQFVAAMLLVQWGYPNYSDASNYVSDLGNSALSPWAWLFNDSIRLLGVLGVAGAMLLAGAFRPGGKGRAGRFFLGLASAGAFLVGTFPEGSPELSGGLHGDASDLTFISAGIALLLLGAAMSGDLRWHGLALGSLALGVVTFVGIVGFEVDSNPAFFGAWERVIIAPILVWGILAGAHLASSPSPPGAGDHASAGWGGAAS